MSRKIQHAHSRKRCGDSAGRSQPVIVAEPVVVAVRNVVELMTDDGAGGREMEQTVATLEHGDVANRATIRSEIVTRDLLQAGQVLNPDETATIPVQPVDRGGASGGKQRQANDRLGLDVNTRDTLDKSDIHSAVVGGQCDAIRVRESLDVWGEEQLQGVGVQADAIHRPLVRVSDEHITVPGNRQVIEQMIALGIGGDIRPQDLAGPQIALEQPRLARGLSKRRRDHVAWRPGGKPQQRACGIGMDSDHAKQIAVSDEIEAGSVLGNANDLALRKAADEPLTREWITGQRFGQEIGIWEAERRCAENNRGPVALQASPNRAELGGAIQAGERGIGSNVRAGAEVREATEPTEGGRGLTDESEPTCDPIHNTRVVGGPPSERMGVIEVVAVTACREGTTSMHSEAPSTARRRSLRAEQRWRQEQGPSARPAACGHSLRPDDRTRIDSSPRPQVPRDVDHDHERREHPLDGARETIRVNNRDQVMRDEATAVASATRAQRECVFQGRERTDETRHCLDINTPARCQQMRGDDPAITASENAATYHEEQEAEVERNNQVSQQAIEHSPSPQAPLFLSSQTFGSQSSILLSSGSMIHANLPFSCDSGPWMIATPPARSCPSSSPRLSTR